MISLETIENEIIELEKRDTTFATVERLSWLYIVRDHLQPVAESRSVYGATGSEFVEACNGLPAEQVLQILAEHFEVIKALYPMEYEAILSKLKQLKT